MNPVLRYGSLIAGLTLGMACGTDQPTAPSPVPTPLTITQPPPTPPQRLPVGEPVATYMFSGPLDYRVRGFTSGSRTSCTRTECSGYGMTRSPTCTWACIDRTTQPSHSGSMARGRGTRDSRQGLSRGICWRSATATSCSTRTSRTPSTADRSSVVCRPNYRRILAQPEHWGSADDRGPRTT
jgi:hypothetical protein